MKYFIGFDVGKNGGIAVFDEKGNIALCSMPQVSKQIDTNGIKKFLSSFEGEKRCVIEDVHSIFGVGAKANFQFGRAAGILEGIVVALDIPFTLVGPKKWQAEMWEGVRPVLIHTGKKTKSGEIKYKIDTKATSLIAAKRLFPNLDLRANNTTQYYSDTLQNRKLGRAGKEIISKAKDHDGIVDAVLIAEYCKRKFA